MSTITSPRPLIRKAIERGVTNINWLKSFHTFSFGQYLDPRFMGFGDLRVINDDTVAPGKGFRRHGHQDMEIFTYVLSGALAHEDSLGNGAVILPGDAQRMSAGTGIEHSEFNHSETDPVHFLQIWIMPNQQGITPGYEQKSIVDRNKHNQLQPLVRPNGDLNTISLHQDAMIDTAILSPEGQLSYMLEPERLLWLHVATGTVMMGDEVLEAGDGVGCCGAQTITLKALEAAEVLWFNLQNPSA